MPDTPVRGHLSLLHRFVSTVCVSVSKCVSTTQYHTITSIATKLHMAYVGIGEKYHEYISKVQRQENYENINAMKLTTIVVISNVQWLN